MLILLSRKVFMLTTSGKQSMRAHNTMKDRDGNFSYSAEESVMSRVHTRNNYVISNFKHVQACYNN